MVAGSTAKHVFWKVHVSQEDEGKVCRREGLWNWARHISYGGYTLWRGGYGLEGGSWVAGSLMLATQAAGFIGQGMVDLDIYMGNRYKKQWVKYKQDVRWSLIPGIH